MDWNPDDGVVVDPSIAAALAAPIVATSSGQMQVSASGRRGQVDTTTRAQVPAWNPDDGVVVQAAQAAPSTLAQVVGVKTPAPVAPVAQEQQTPETQAAAQVPQSVDQIESVPAGQMIFPRLSALAQGEGASALPAAYAAGKDLLSLPGRTVAGAISGLGTLSDSGPGILQRAALAAEQGMTDPGTSADPAWGGVAGQILKDPTTIPLAAATGGEGMLLQALKGANIIGGRQVADYLATPTTEVGKQVTPGANLAGSAIGTFVPGVIGKGLRRYTEPNVAQWNIVPRDAAAEGLHDFAEAGHWPKVVPAWNSSRREIGEEFLKEFPKQMKEVEAWKVAADRTATKDPTFKYPQDRVIDAMDQAFKSAQKFSEGKFTPADQNRAMTLVLNRMSGSDPELLPSQVQHYKSTFGTEGYDQTSTKGLSAAKEIAFKGAAADMRNFLSTKFPEYQPIMDRVQPWVAAKPAFEIAAKKGGNLKPGGLMEVEGANVGANVAGMPGAIAAALLTAARGGPKGYLAGRYAAPALEGASKILPSLYPAIQRQDAAKDRKRP